MKIKMHMLTYYLLLLLIAGITIDTLETWYGFNLGLQETNPITLFIMQLFDNKFGVLMSGIFKTMALIILYALSIMIKSTVDNMNIFSKRFIRWSLDICIVLFLLIANYTTYFTIWNNLILILR